MIERKGNPRQKNNEGESITSMLDLTKVETIRHLMERRGHDIVNEKELRETEKSLN